MALISHPLPPQQSSEEIDANVVSPSLLARPLAGVPRTPLPSIAPELSLTAPLFLLQVQPL